MARQLQRASGSVCISDMAYKHMRNVPSVLASKTNLYCRCVRSCLQIALAREVRNCASPHKLVMSNLFASHQDQITYRNYFYFSALLRLFLRATDRLKRALHPKLTSEEASPRGFHLRNYMCQSYCRLLAVGHAHKK